MFDYSHVMILFMSKTVICPICFCPNSSKNLVKLSVTILYRCDLCGVVFVPLIFIIEEVISLMFIRLING